MNLQAGFVRVVSSFAWIMFEYISISQYLGWPGLTNVKLHWYDQLHLQINTLVNHH